MHYNINALQMQQWAQAIERLDATIANPPTSSYSFWVNKQKGVGRSTQPRLTGYQQVEKTLQDFQQEAAEARAKAEIEAERRRIERQRERDEE